MIQKRGLQKPTDPVSLMYGYEHPPLNDRLSTMSQASVQTYIYIDRQIEIDIDRDTYIYIVT